MAQKNNSQHQNEIDRDPVDGLIEGFRRSKRNVPQHRAGTRQEYLPKLVSQQNAGETEEETTS